MTQQYDAIIIGGGHNGLVAAAMLAKARKRVLVLEKRDVLGGAAATEEIWPGYRVDTGATDAGMFQDGILNELSLTDKVTFRECAAALYAPEVNGRSLTLYPNIAKSVASIAQFSQQDADRFPAFYEEVNRMAAIFKGMMRLTPPNVMQRNFSDLTAWGGMGLKLKRLGKKEMMEFLRVLPMPIQAYLDEWFESDLLKGALGGYGITGLRQGPRSAGTTLMFLYQHVNGFLRHRTVVGGMGQLSVALADAARENGAEVRVGTAVSHININSEDYSIQNVILENGEALQASVILSSADPRRTFFELVGPQNLEPHFMRHVGNIMYRGSTAKMNLAVSRLPQFAGQPDNEQLSGHIRISPSLDYLEKGYDASKYGRFSPNPYLDITIPTISDPALAPAGHHILSINMQFAPYELRESDWDTERERLGNHIIDTLSQYAPDLKELILHQQLLTPLDWERSYSLTEGSIHHGQMGLDQLLVMRPVAGWGQYQTPIANLYLCGAGAHPGGGVTGAPGYNAAREVLRSE
ncbi:Beta-carotene ketolase [hydrothermal vent metagenome]|uniref:Pyridine nucleotide-disulfide oxidoreductase domain-containing protein 2 n=1 Tax=hydrothermal vent metagenome TaxID=652676 RepID=A0A3B0UQ28_9ZZZZ